jgi:hypothetical protein
LFFVLSFFSGQNIIFFFFFMSAKLFWTFFILPKFLYFALFF